MPSVTGIYDDTLYDDSLYAEGGAPGVGIYDVTLYDFCLYGSAPTGVVVVEFPGVDIPFIIVELDVYKPGTLVVTTTESHLSRPHLALADLEDPAEISARILASDLGYRTMETDVGGIVPYPPILDQAFQVDNKINLELSASGVGAAWGTIVLSNVDNQFDTMAGTFNSDGRGVRILTGMKSWDGSRQYHRDPSYASLRSMWAGVATPWFLSDTALTIPIRDATYWLDRPYQNSVYTGTGTYFGTPTLAGKPLPRTRGGTAAEPVMNVSPTLVDPLNRIYQYTDGPGTVVRLYEGGAQVITYSGDTTNLYAGGCPAGQYRTDNSRGLFQLGSVAVHAITCDVTGQFSLAGTITTFAQLALYILTEDLLLPSELIDVASFIAVDASWPYTAGGYYGSDAAVTGIDVLTAVLAGPGCKMISKRDGRLGLYMPRALPVGVISEVIFDLSNIIKIDPIPLPATLDPPPYRIRSEYDHNFTVQTSDMNTASMTAAHKQFVEMTGSFSYWSSTAVLTAFRRPNDPPPIQGLLLKQSEAQAVVNDLGALWGVRRRLYDVTVPAFIGVALDMGHVVTLKYPMDDLTNGLAGQIVGYSFRSPDASVVLRVLI
jgi:hypothetical protein